MLLVASRQHIRSVGQLESYERALAPEVRGELENVTSSSWVPLPLAQAHFRAIDGLSISDADILTMTGAVAEKIHGVFLSAISRAIRSSGVTPWSVVPVAAKIWPRFLQGGAVGVRRDGPKDARVIVAGNPLVSSRYHRIGWGAHLATTVRMVAAHRVVMRVAHLEESRGRLEYLLQWV